jgi:hypothetical protein
MSSHNHNNYIQPSLDFDHTVTLPEGNIVPEKLRSLCIESLKDITSQESLSFCFDLLNAIQLEFGQNDELQRLLLLDDAIIGMVNVIHNINQVDIKLLSKIPVNKRIERSQLVPNQNRLRLLDGSAVELDMQLLPCLSRLSELQLFFLECFVLAFDNLDPVVFPVLSQIQDIAGRDNPTFLQNEARGYLISINHTVRTAHLQNGLPADLTAKETPDEQLEYLQDLDARGILGMKFPVLPVARVFSQIIHLLIPHILQENVSLGAEFRVYQEAAELTELANQLQQNGLFVANLEQAAAILEKENILQDALVTSIKYTTDWLMYTLISNWLVRIGDPKSSGLQISTEEIMQILQDNILSCESIAVIDYLYDISRPGISQIFQQSDIDTLINIPELHSLLTQLILSSNESDTDTFLKSIHWAIYNWLIVNREDVISAVNNYLITIARTVQFFSNWEIPEDAVVLVEQELSLKDTSTQKDQELPLEEDEVGYADMIIINGLHLPDNYDRSHLTLAKILNLITEETTITLYEIKARKKKPPTTCPTAADIRQVADYNRSLLQLGLTIDEIVFIYPSVENIGIFKLDPAECTEGRGKDEGRTAKKRRREAKES